MVVVLAGALAVFVATNLDGLVLLTVVFGVPNVRARSVVAAQFLGLTALIAISAVAAAGLFFVPRRWIGLAGIVPIALGARMLLRHQYGPTAKPPLTTAAIAGLVLADGVDNVSVYTPTFRAVGATTAVAYVALFYLFAALWCAIAWWLSRRPPIAETIDRWSHIIVPIVFIVVGLGLVLTALA